MLLCLKIIKNLNATVDSFLGIGVKVVLKPLFTALCIVLYDVSAHFEGRKNPLR